MSSSPILECRCIHCDQRVTAAEKRRNGFACDRCVTRLARERYEWARGAMQKRHRKYDRGNTLH